jgi:hypothetical protein
MMLSSQYGGSQSLRYQAPRSQHPLTLSVSGMVLQSRKMPPGLLRQVLLHEYVTFAVVPGPHSEGFKALLSVF